MGEVIEIYCQNTASTLFVKVGSSLIDVMNMVWPMGSTNIVAAYCDNKIKELHYRIYSPKSVNFVSLATTEGMRVYSRSLFFLLERAVKDVIPQGRLHIMYPMGRGCYAEIEGIHNIETEQIEQIKARMVDLVDQNVPIVRLKMKLDNAIELFRSMGCDDKIKLLSTRPYFYVSMFNLAGLHGYFYGAMVPSTGYIKLFDIKSFGEGMVVLMPRKESPTELETMSLQPKLFDVFALNKEWSRILNVDNVGSLNEHVMQGHAGDLIKVGEALQEKNFARIADTIHEAYLTRGVRLILIAGPSSSGKTTFSKRLEIQLRVLGLKPRSVSLDNYFVERERTPLDENGAYDFESIDAIDYDDFNSDLLRLIAGEEVELPRFSFQTGNRFFDGTSLQLDNSGILIVEGIHALNPLLTSKVDDGLKFKIYASALTTLSIDNMSVVHTTDNRLLRRMVRDNQFRNRSAQATIEGWPSVRRGEDKHIFPYQEQADVMFNTSLFFELPILKRHVMPLLLTVPPNAPEYAEALRLMKFLNCFVDIPDTELPPTSILREFIGGSSFGY